MTSQALRFIAAGLLAGVAIFLVPFIIIRVLVIVLIFRLIFRLVGGRRSWRGYPYSGFQHAFSRKWERMSDEEKRAFREKMENEYFNKMNS